MMILIIKKKVDMCTKHKTYKQIQIKIEIKGSFYSIHIEDLYIVSGISSPNIIEAHCDSPIFLTLIC